jgi:hypoxanthine phosphoribosyltransferase
MKFFATLEEVNSHSQRLFNLDEIELALNVMVQDITVDMCDKRPVVLGVMRGALAILGYMLPRFPFYLEVDYVHASRYKNKLITGELLWLHEPHIALTGRNVLLVEDILDQGVTLKAISEKCYSLGAREVKIAVLCKKHIDNFLPAIEADYIALDVPDAYIFGYGMDYEGGWRNAPGIYKLTK